MALPTADAYNDAIQIPRLAFPDPVLASGNVECNGFGIPKAFGGTFALTYRVTNSGGRAFAVRCFHKQSNGLEERYRSIHKCLAAAGLQYFVDFEFQQNGMRVGGSAFPIVKMEWVDGVTLGEFVEHNHGNRQAMERLRFRFAILEQELATKGVAHGDLQNENVIVDDTRLRLVDYDGMYVTGMPLGKGAELGQKHFQHPLRRAADFGPDIDRFSFIIIDLSLWALSIRPDLFMQFSTGQNLLFSANDFADPDSSRVFRTLSQIGDSGFQQSVGDFICVCKADTKSVPRLTDFHSRMAVPKVAVQKLLGSAAELSKYIGALPVVDATSFEAVCRHVGDRVELVGHVVETKAGATRDGKPYVCIHFRKLRENCVRATIASEGLKALGDRPYDGQWFVINGLIEPGSNKYSEGWFTFGPTVNDRSQLHRISKEEALWRLGKGPRTGGTVAKAMPIQNKNAEILTDLGVLAKPPIQQGPATSKPTTAGVISKSTSTGTPSVAKTTTGQSAIKTRNEEVLQSIVGKTPSSPVRGSSVADPQQKPKPKGCATLAAMILAAFLAGFVSILGYALDFIR